MSKLPWVVSFALVGGLIAGCELGGDDPPPPGSPALSWRLPSSPGTAMMAPWGIALDADGNLIVSEFFGNAVGKYSPRGQTLLRWGSSGGAAGLSAPKFLDVDASGNVYVGDTGNHRILKFDSLGNYVGEWGGYGTGDGQFNGPAGIAVDAVSEVIYVMDSNNDRVEKFDLSGSYLGQWGSSGTGNGQFHFFTATEDFGPEGGAAVDGSGNVYVVDNVNHRVQKFDSSGNYLTQWGVEGSGPGQFAYASPIEVDDTGNVYVADNSTPHNEPGNFARVQKFDANGAFVAEFRPLFSSACGGGAAYVIDIAVESTGYIWLVTGECVAKYAPL